MALSKVARTVWEELPDDVKEDAVMSVWDVIRGKPPRLVRIAKLRAETLKAKIEVRQRLTR
jgi:hypothetical protein